MTPCTCASSFTAYYGLRRSEVLGLKWSSIDFERKSITINHKVTEQLVNGKYVPVVSDVMKNKTSCRTLPLIPAVEERTSEAEGKAAALPQAVQEELQH